MARSTSNTAINTEAHEQEPNAPKLEDAALAAIGDLGDFEFRVEEGIAIPETVRTNVKVPEHPWVGMLDKMGHNSTFFVPTAYWAQKRGIAVERATDPAWQRNAINQSFLTWRKKDAARAKWALTRIHRELGADPTFAAQAGVRCWLVDTTRASAPGPK